MKHFGDRLQWPIKSHNNGGQTKVKGYEEREITNLLILDLKDGKLWDSGKEEEGETFHKLHALGMNYTNKD